MKGCKRLLLRLFLILLAGVPAYAQRGTFGIDLGQASDKFGALPSVSGLMAGIDGQVAIFKKEGGTNIVVGGEIRFPSDTSNHAKEFAIFGGPVFEYHSLSIGVNAQVRKIILPPANVNNQIFVRYKMELLELPVTVKYNFGASRHAFIQAEGAPEFTPRFRNAGSLTPLPNPNLDHGYFVRGSVGYIFSKYYVKGSYETRYFKFAANPHNPSGLYNWRTNTILAGVGFVF